MAAAAGPPHGPPTLVPGAGIYTATRRLSWGNACLALPFLATVARWTFRACESLLLFRVDKEGDDPTDNPSWEGNRSMREVNERVSESPCGLQ